jgi:hypothetical protein
VRRQRLDALAESLNEVVSADRSRLLGNRIDQAQHFFER